jgi:hypothetical protein
VLAAGNLAAILSLKLATVASPQSFACFG